MNPPRFVGARLSGMMFLQYFGLGAWIVSMARYLGTAPEYSGLGFTPAEVGMVYATLPVAGMLTPLVVVPLADRYFSAQKLLGCLQFFMAAVLAWAAWWCHSPLTSNPWSLTGIMQVYAFALQPTLTLTNVIAMKNLPNPAGQFGNVRLFGTFGWIVAGGVVSSCLDPVSFEPIALAAVTSLVMGGYAFTLPPTPPGSRGSRGRMRDAVGLFRRPAFAAFALAIILGNMMNQFYVLFAAQYFDYRDIPKPEAVMTLGQWCEMGCMAAIPLAVRVFGLKTVMTAGLLGWVARNASLAYGSDASLMAVALPMHGFSYVFFTLVGALVVDREAPQESRASAQALVTFLGSGPAVLVGNYFAGQVASWYTAADGDVNWTGVWVVPLIGCAAGGRAIPDSVPGE